MSFLTLDMPKGLKTYIENRDFILRSLATLTETLLKWRNKKLECAVAEAEIEFLREAKLLMTSSAESYPGVIDVYPVEVRSLIESRRREARVTGSERYWSEESRLAVAFNKALGQRTPCKKRGKKIVLQMKRINYQDFQKIPEESIEFLQDPLGVFEEMGEDENGFRAEDVKKLLRGMAIFRAVDSFIVKKGTPLENPDD